MRPAPARAGRAAAGAEKARPEPLGTAAPSPAGAGRAGPEHRSAESPCGARGLPRDPLESPRLGAAGGQDDSPRGHLTKQEEQARAPPVTRDKDRASLLSWGPECRDAVTAPRGHCAAGAGAGAGAVGGSGLPSAAPSRPGARREARARAAQFIYLNNKHPALRGARPGQFLNGTRHCVFTQGHPRRPEGFAARPRLQGMTGCAQGCRLPRNVGDASGARAGAPKTPSSRPPFSSPV